MRANTRGERAAAHQGVDEAADEVQHFRLIAVDVRCSNDHLVLRRIALQHHLCHIVLRAPFSCSCWLQMEHVSGSDLVTRRPSGTHYSHSYPKLC